MHVHQPMTVSSCKSRTSPALHSACYSRAGEVSRPRKAPLRCCLSGTSQSSPARGCRWSSAEDSIGERDIAKLYGTGSPYVSLWHKEPAKSEKYHLVWPLRAWIYLLQTEDHPQLAGALSEVRDLLSEEDQVGGLQLVLVLRQDTVGDLTRQSVENLISLLRVETSPDVLVEALPEENFQRLRADIGRSVGQLLNYPVTLGSVASTGVERYWCYEVFCVVRVTSNIIIWSLKINNKSLPLSTLHTAIAGLDYFWTKVCHYSALARFGWVT